MAAYLIADVEITDVEAYREYGRAFDPILERFGGRILVNGGPTVALEGAWHPARLVILEFPDSASARSWYESPEYRAITPIRQQNAVTHYLTMIEGWNG